MPHPFEHRFKQRTVPCPARRGITPTSLRSSGLVQHKEEGGVFHPPPPEEGWVGGGCRNGVLVTDQFEEARLNTGDDSPPTTGRDENHLKERLIACDV